VSAKHKCKLDKQGQTVVSKLATSAEQYVLESVANIPRNYGEEDRLVSCQKDRLLQGSHSLTLKN